MKPLSSDTRLRNLYNQYLYIEDKAYYDKIRFFDQNESDILLMRLEDSLWIHSCYLDALFQTGEYKKFDIKAQDYLQRLIYHNISYFHGENPFEDTLHKKIISLYHIKNYDFCIDQARQLININPSRKDTQKVLFAAHRSSHTLALKTIKAGLMGTLLMTAFLLVFQQIIIASFFTKMSAWFLQLIMAVTIPFLSIFLGYKVFIDVKCWLQSRSWVKKAKAKKSKI